MKLTRTDLLLLGGFAAVCPVLISPPRSLALWMAGRSECGPIDTYRALKAREDWQSLSRQLESTSSVIRTDGRLRLTRTPRGDWWTARSSSIFGLLAGMEANPYSEVRPGDVVLDVGANVGGLSKVFLDAGAKLVVAIEASPDSAECLRRNHAAAIAAGRVIVVAKAAWDKEESLTFYVHDNESALDSATIKHGNSVTIPATTIDRIISDLGIAPTYIKMDIEGAEHQALRGATRTLKTYRPRMSVAIEHLPNDRTAIPSLVQSIEPSYTAECGRCWPLYLRDGYIAPDTMLFYAR